MSRYCCRRAKPAIGSLYNLLVASSRPTRLLQAPIIAQEYANHQHFLTPPPRCISNLSGKKTSATTTPPVCSSLSSSSLIAAAAALKPVKPARIIGNNAYMTTAAANPVVTPFWQRKRILLRFSAFALASASVGFVVWVARELAEEETVPYTKRTRYVSLPHFIEQDLGDMAFQSIKASYGEKVLPQDHPDSVRVSLITRRIVEALQRGITQQTVWSNDQSSSSSSCCFDSERDYLQELNWEVMVVDSTDEGLAISLLGGKIVVFTDLLKHSSTTDVEIATVVGHEVGHVVARHLAECFKWRLAINCIMLELVFATVAIVGFSKFALLPAILFCAVSNHLYQRLSQRMECEADYIGLLLIASAGYDPRLAPKVHAELCQGEAASELGAYCGSHPSGKKRAWLLAQPQVMEEAMAIYKQVGSIPPVLQQDLGDSNSGASTTETRT